MLGFCEGGAEGKKRRQPQDFFNGYGKDAL